MAAIKAIKKRITSVTNTKKIMKAMNLVAASKLQKSKARLDAVKPMYYDFKKVIENVKSAVEDDVSIPFAEEREEVKNIAYIVLTGDRGLCGAFNSTISKEAFAFVEAHKEQGEKIIAVGSKGFDYFRRRGKNIIQRCEAASEASSFDDADALVKMIIKMYSEGEVDEVYLIYTHFESVLAHIPYIEKLLPLKISASDQEQGEAAATTATFMTYDPDINTFITNAVPMYLSVTVFEAMMESAACEEAARMTSMDSASRNATEIIDDLTLEFNRKRQGMITQEITEIVSGANAQA